MRKSILFIVPVILLAASLACSIPGIDNVDPGAVNTSAAQTVIAKLTAYPQTATLPAAFYSPTAYPTFTLAPSTVTPSLTPTASHTATASPRPTSAYTSTPTYPWVTVSITTNCRTGPSVDYDIIGYLNDGVPARVYGRDASALYWYIRNPDDSHSYCWIWGEYATFNGKLSEVPVYTPQPTPTQTPRFIINYTGLDACKNWWTEYKLTNPSSDTYKSMKIVVLDTVTKKTTTKTTDGFVNKNGCLAPITKPALAPGQSLITISQAFGYNPKGHKLRTTITLCTQKGLGGSCYSLVINFKP